MVMADGKVQPSPFLRELLEMKEAHGTDQDPPSHDAEGEPVPLFSIRQIYASFAKASTSEVSEGLDPAQAHPELHSSQTIKTCCQISMSQFSGEESTYLAIPSVMLAYCYESRGDFVLYESLFLKAHSI